MTEDVRIVQIRAAAPGEWDAAWASSPAATYFHSREWAAVWAEYSGGRMAAAPRLVGFADGLSAVLVGSRERLYRGLAGRLLSTPSGTYGGWLAGPEAQPAHATALARLLLREGDLWWRLNPFDETLAGRIPHGAESDVTHVLDLRHGFDAVQAGWSRGHRSAANKGRRAGVEVVRATSPEDWLAYFAMYEDSRRRWLPTSSPGYEWRLFEILRDLGSSHVELWLACVGGRAVAGALCFTAPRHVVYWHGAALSEYFHLRPVNWLMSEIIRDVSARGFDWFDFNPSGGLPGVETFKERFGTRVLPCPVVRRTSIRLTVLRKLRGRQQLTHTASEARNGG